MRRFSALLCLTLAALAPAPAAWADGDPASDVLLAQDVSLPYAPNTVSKPMEKALETTVARAKAKGFGVKVALIADRRDLGSVGEMIGEPQRYADLLTTELSLNVTHGRRVQAPRVLTVLPNGLGGNNLGDTAGDALADVPVPEGGADALARTAAVAVGKLAAAAGRPIDLPTLPAASSAPASSGGGGIPTAILFGAPVLLLVLVVVALNARMGGEDEPGDAPAPG
jgi:hypothetical protein